MSRFNGMVAIVTGAGAGIGRACALRLAKDGAKVVVCDINEKAANETKETIENAGGVAAIEIFDLLDSEAIFRTAENAKQKFGRIDILVTSGGGSAGLIGKLTEFKDSEKATRDWVVGLNLTSTMDFCDAVVDTMIEQNYGKIINIASIAASVGIRYRCDYSAAKAGMVAFTKVLAVELGKYNISINCVSPGAIARENYNVEGMTKYGPNGRMGTPEEVANLVCFLASHEADFITGQDYIIDGGRVLGPGER